MISNPSDDNVNRPPTRLVYPASPPVSFGLVLHDPALAHSRTPSSNTIRSLQILTPSCEALRVCQFESALRCVLLSDAWPPNAVENHNFNSSHTSLNHPGRLAMLVGPHLASHSTPGRQKCIFIHAPAEYAYILLSTASASPSHPPLAAAGN